MSMTTKLMADIDAFLKRTGMSLTAFGEQACRDKHVVKRMLAGKSITLRRADQIRAFMSAYEGAGRPHPKRRRAGDRAAA